MISRSLFFALSLAAATARASAHDDHAEHAFVVLGEGDVHLYHLARFDSPHRWQALVRVTLRDADGAPLDLATVENADPGRLFGLLTKDRFPLEDLGAGAVRRFQADLYSGYLRDQAGRRLVRRDVAVEIRAVERFAELHAADESPGRYELLTTCDEETGVFYGAHRVTGKPGFEQLVAIDAVGERCDDAHRGRVAALLSPAAGDRPLEDRDFLAPWTLSGPEGTWTAAPRRSLLLDAAAINR